MVTLQRGMQQICQNVNGHIPKNNYKWCKKQNKKKEQKEYIFSLCFYSSLNSRSCSRKRLVRSSPSPLAWGSWRMSRATCGRCWRKKKRARRMWRSRSRVCRPRSVHCVTLSHLNKVFFIFIFFKSLFYIALINSYWSCTIITSFLSQ